MLPPIAAPRVHQQPDWPHPVPGDHIARPEHSQRCHRSVLNLPPPSCPCHPNSFCLSSNVFFFIPIFFSLLCLPADGSSGSALLALLVEQAALKQAELDAHPVRFSMKQLLRSLDQLCPFEPDGDPSRPDYVRSFLDYVNTLASVLVRSLGSEGMAFVHQGAVWGRGLKCNSRHVLPCPPFRSEQ